MDTEERIPFAAWNIGKVVAFYNLTLPLPPLSLELAPPVSEESLYRFVSSLQDVNSIFIAGDRDPKVRNLVLGRFLQEAIKPFPHLTLHIGRTLVGRNAYGPSSFSVGSLALRLPYILVLECSAQAQEKHRGQALVQMRAAFERMTIARRLTKRLFAIVTDTREWQFYMYEPARFRFYEAERITVADVYDVDALENLLCALNFVFASAQEENVTNRRSDADSRLAARIAAQFVPFKGLDARPPGAAMQVTANSERRASIAAMRAMDGDLDDGDDEDDPFDDVDSYDDDYPVGEGAEHVATWDTGAMTLAQKREEKLRKRKAMAAQMGNRRLARKASMATAKKQ